MWITTNCGKYFKRWEYQTTLPASLEICMQVKKQQLDWLQIGKEVHQGYICHLVYLTSMQSTSCEMPAWMKHKLESRLRGSISVTSDAQMTPPFGRKQRSKEPLDESERGVKKLA